MAKYIYILFEHINFLGIKFFDWWKSWNYNDERSFNWFVSNNSKTIVGHKNVKNNGAVNNNIYF